MVSGSDWASDSVLRDPADPHLVVAHFDGRSLCGWKQLSGIWRIRAKQILHDSSPSRDHHLQFSDSAAWSVVTFEFMGGSPGIRFAGTKGQPDGRMINLDADQRHNGEIRRAVDMRIWNTVRVERVRDTMEVFLNGERVYDSHWGDSESFLTIKAQRGQLRIRRISAIGVSAGL